MDVAPEVSKLGKLAKIERGVDDLSQLGKDISRVEEGAANTVTRPTPRQSEIDVGSDLGSEVRPQVSYKNINGQVQEVPYGTPGSVRPDFVTAEGTASFEVKNYNVATNSNGLINNVSQQAIDRANHLPSGMEQQIIIDVRGQMITPQQENAIVQGIVQKSNGVISPTAIGFKKQ